MTAWPWPAPPDDGGALHLARGMPLPDVALLSTSGERVRLARHEGRAILFVYPWTGRPGRSNPPGWDEIPGAHGSTPQLERVRDLRAAFARLGAAVFGLSTQDRAWQCELAARLALDFELLSDAPGEFSLALRLPRFETGGVSYLRRLTLSVLDGNIERVFYPVHPPDTHPRDVLVWLAAVPSGAG